MSFDSRLTLLHSLCGVSSAKRPQTSLTFRLKEDWISAYDLCRDLARDCAEQHIWEPASRFALAGAIRAHQHLALDKHEDWTNLALAYLRTCAIVADQPSSIEVERVLEGFREQEIEYTGESLRACYAYWTAEHHRAFEVRVDGDLAAWTDEPGVSSIKVAITNLLSNVSVRYNWEKSDSHRAGYVL